LWRKKFGTLVVTDEVSSSCLTVSSYAHESGDSVRILTRSVKMKAKKVVFDAFPYDMSGSVDENVRTITIQMDNFMEEVALAHFN
jgi:hypothetical protein